MSNMEYGAYHKEIVDAVNSLPKTKEPISLKDVINELADVIVIKFDKSPISSYKADWIRRIALTLNILKIPFSNRKKQDWEGILADIIDKSNGFCQAANDTRAERNQPGGESSQAACINSYSSSSSSTIKQQKMTKADFQKVESIYNKLDNKKKWTLSSGTIVEDRMKQFALDCVVEHPSHSIIFDTSDKCWETVFDQKDLEEMKTYKLKPLPPLPSKMQEYMNSLKPITDLELLYTTLKQRDFRPLKDTQLEWIQSSLYSCIKLFMFNFFPLTDQSESDMLKRLWLFIDTAFDDSLIICRSGEKSSFASSSSRNLERTIGGKSKIQRKLCGRKLDMVFKRCFDEYALTECSRYHQFNDTKQLMDGGFKMPKVLKDMFVNLSDSSPTKVREIVTVGYQLMETKFILSTMDSPAGAVCRVNHLYPLQFPNDPQLITKQLLQILEVVYRSRLIIESTRDITSDQVIAFDLCEEGPIPPCFNIQPMSTTSEEQKKRKNTF